MVNSQPNHRENYSTFPDSLAHNQGKTVYLDPSGKEPIPDDCIVIGTERDWIQDFFVREGKYWVKGKRLCDWTEEWLRVWNLRDAIAPLPDSSPLPPPPPTPAPLPPPPPNSIFKGGIEGFDPNSF